MYIDIFVLIFLVAGIVGLSLAMLFLVRFYSHMIKKIEETDQEKLLIQNNITQKAKEVLQQAHSNNEAIIAKANQDAARILSDASSTRADTEELQKQKLTELSRLQTESLNKLSADFLKSYQDGLARMQNEDLLEAKKISDNFENQVEEKLDNFSETLKQETIQAEKEVHAKTEAEYTAANAEIEAYKEKEMQKVREQVYPLLQKVSMLVLGKSLSVEDHEKLIQKALEDAQKEMNHNISNHNNLHPEPPSVPAT